MRPHTPPKRRLWPPLFLALAVGFMLGAICVYLFKTPAATLTSKLLEWPFLTFLLIACLVLLFFNSLETLISRGEFTIAWGKDQSIKVRDLSSALDEELDPIRDDIEQLKKDVNARSHHRLLFERAPNLTTQLGHGTEFTGIFESIEPAPRTPRATAPPPAAATEQAPEPEIVTIDPAPAIDPTPARIQRLRDALANHEFKWRSIERLAAIIGASEDETIKLILTQPDITLGMGKSGRQIAGLRSRVG